MQQYGLSLICVNKEKEINTVLVKIIHLCEVKWARTIQSRPIFQPLSRTGEIHLELFRD